MEPSDELLRKHRHAARALLADEQDRLLLLSSLLERRDCIIWLAPGGALEDGESHREAAVRECWEETGLELHEEPAHVWNREHTWQWHGRIVHTVERYFFARVQHFEPDAPKLEAYEEELFRGYRWWTLDELRASDELLVPEALPELLEPLLDGELPETPIETGA